MTFPAHILDRAERAVLAAKSKGWLIATAESCTGGLISSALTEVSGASAVFTHGFVTYANRAKTEMLGVPAADLEAFGAVSPEVAAAMAEGALTAAKANLTIAVTGIAGPEGGTPEKPVGTVWFGCAVKKPGDNLIKVNTEKKLFADRSRNAIRLATVEYALSMVLAELIQRDEKQP